MSSADNRSLAKKRATQKIDNKIAKLQLEYNRLHHNLMFLILDKDWGPAHNTLNELIACDAQLKSRKAELATRKARP